MLATLNDWMLGLPVVLQALVAFAVISAIGLTPLVLWLVFAVVSTSEPWQGRRYRGGS